MPGTPGRPTPGRPSSPLLPAGINSQTKWHPWQLDQQVDVYDHGNVLSLGILAENHTQQSLKLNASKKHFHSFTYWKISEH